MKAHAALTNRHKQELEAATRRASTAEALHRDVWAARMHDQKHAEERLQKETTRADAATERAEMWFDKYNESRDARCEDNKRIGNLESELAATKAKLAATKAELAATEAVNTLTKRQRKQVKKLARDPKRRCVPHSLRQ